VFRECQHIYGKRGENGESETNIINELTWIMWELSERVGEFSTGSEKKLSAAISLSAVEIAKKVNDLYQSTRPAKISDPTLKLPYRYGGKIL